MGLTSLANSDRLWKLPKSQIEVRFASCCCLQGVGSLTIRRCYHSRRKSVFLRAVPLHEAANWIKWPFRTFPLSPHTHKFDDLHKWKNVPFLPKSTRFVGQRETRTRRVGLLAIIFTYPLRVGLGISKLCRSPLATPSRLFQSSIVLVVAKRFHNLAARTFNHPMEPKKARKGEWEHYRKLMHHDDGNRGNWAVTPLDGFWSFSLAEIVIGWPNESERPWEAAIRRWRRMQKGRRLSKIREKVYNFWDMFKNCWF